MYKPLSLYSSPSTWSHVTIPIALREWRPLVLPTFYDEKPKPKLSNLPKKRKLTDHQQGLPWWLSGKESPCQGKRHRFTAWSGKTPHAGEQLSPWPRLWAMCSRAQTLQLLKPARPRASAPQQEKPLQWEAHAPRLDSGPQLSTAGEKPTQHENPTQP